MQALVTLNDEQFVEASRAFAQRIIKALQKTLKIELTGHSKWRPGILRTNFEKKS